MQLFAMFMGFVFCLTHMLGSLIMLAAVFWGKQQISRYYINTMLFNSLALTVASLLTNNSGVLMFFLVSLVVWFIISATTFFKLPA